MDGRGRIRSTDAKTAADGRPPQSEGNVYSFLRVIWPPKAACIPLRYHGGLD